MKYVFDGLLCISVCSNFAASWSLLLALTLCCEPECTSMHTCSDCFSVLYLNGLYSFTIVGWWSQEGVKRWKCLWSDILTKTPLNKPNTLKLQQSLEDRLDLLFLENWLYTRYSFTLLNVFNVSGLSYCLYVGICFIVAIMVCCLTNAKERIRVLHCKT